jgi:hypothetical protein
MPGPNTAGLQLGGPVRDRERVDPSPKKTSFVILKTLMVVNNRFD